MQRAVRDPSRRTQRARSRSRSQNPSWFSRRTTPTRANHRRGARARPPTRLSIYLDAARRSLQPLWDRFVRIARLAPRRVELRIRRQRRSSRAAAVAENLNDGSRRDAARTHVVEARRRLTLFVPRHALLTAGVAGAVRGRVGIRQIAERRAATRRARAVRHD